jgi:hypothetical protein
MKKMTLELTNLRVESFPTTPEEPREHGTVRGHASTAALPCETCMTGCVGQCGGYGESEIASCGCPTEAGCGYPSTSCRTLETQGGATCYCLYPNTDVRRCCSAVDYCSGAGAMC